MKKRAPNWKRDEIILALDLYFSLEKSEMNSKNPKVIEVSRVLNLLPIHQERGSKFRNPNGIELKLCNFKAIDPDFKGKGMSSYSKLDESIFFEFKNEIASLSNLAEKIKKTIDEGVELHLYNITEDSDEFYSVKEGEVIYKLHRYKERNSSIVKKKKRNYLKKYGKLDCEVCGFVFEDKYGILGEDFVECHHRTPLANLEYDTKTTLKDLALVCSNCHRMLHKGNISINELKKRLINLPS